jgi:alkanesulfonate monooxygenase SsuD/methylene tetrahydromethanopterin reductase-like flavin-dependent oxidoreductase (luciferase family)
MQVGLVLPQGYFNEFEGWEPGRAWARIVELAHTAEQLGFESIWTGEHVVSKWPGESIAFDCWALSSGLAPLVPRVGIGMIVLNSTFHNPAMTAKAAATLDTISGGRLTLGLGAGFKPNEAQAFGFDYLPIRERMELLSELLRSSGG